MSTQDKIRWLKAAAQLLVSAGSFMDNLDAKDRTQQWVAIREQVRQAYHELIAYIVDLGG